MGRYARGDHELKMMNEVHRMADKMKDKKELRKMLTLVKDGDDRVEFNDSTVKVGKGTYQQLSACCCRMTNISAFLKSLPLRPSS